MNRNSYVGQGVEGSISLCQLQSYFAGQHAHHPESLQGSFGHCDCTGSLTLYQEVMVSALVHVSHVNHTGFEALYN